MISSYFRKFQSAKRLRKTHRQTTPTDSHISQTPSRLSLPPAIGNIITVPKNFEITDRVNHVLTNFKEKNPFYVVNVDRIESQFKRWTTHLPFVKPFYAIKSNPDRVILQVLQHLGAGFDCASQKEIQEVLSLGIKPKKIIFANPVKPPQHLDYAASVGVDLMTADNYLEIVKIAQYHPNARVVIRLKPDDSQSICQFSSKFGASEEEAREMIKLASKIGINIVGVSFHVGSGCQSAQTFVDILKTSADIFSFGTDNGFEMRLLDIGGGFPGLGAAHTGDSFETMGGAISGAVDNFFEKFSDIEIIAEPGRFFSAGAFSLVTNVIGKKSYANNAGEPGFKYYIDEGVYGGFNCIIFDHYTPQLELLKPKENAKLFNSVVFGPTCDSMDKVGEFKLPELAIGDRLFVESFGAYTSTSSSMFNGFGNLKRYYFTKEES